MNLEFETRKCKCCFPFYCGHKKIIISNMNYELLMILLKDSPSLIKTQKKEEPYKRGKEAIKRLRARN